MANANGAQATGLGDDATYGDGSGAKGRLAKRTYYFEYDKYVVQPDDKAAILANADWIAAHPNSKVILEGHTDPRGSREYNIALGESRAKSVLDILQSRGVNPNQIRIVSYGAERPAATGRTDQDFQLDRRAILVAQK
jgi:peptidoglycan-associated lipoprotein